MVKRSKQRGVYVYVSIQFLFKFVKMDVHSASAASVDDLSAVRDAIKRGEDVNSVNKVS